MRRSLVFVVLSTLLTSGCAIGNKYAFDYRPATVADVAQGASILLLEPLDQRSYIVSGDEPPDFVGEQRNGYGMPFNVTTADGRPFSETVGSIAKNDLEAAGYRVTLVDDSPDAIGALLKERGIDRGLVLVIREFESDTMTNITVDWDIEASVYDQNGKIVTTESDRGSEDLVGSFMNPPKAARQKVPAFLHEKIHELLNRPSIQSALRG